MTKVNHKGIVIETGYGILTTTLCGRVSRETKDCYMNVVKDNSQVTCKHCLNVMKTSWGKAKIEKSIK